MQDDGQFVGKLFIRHASMNTVTQLSSVIGPLICGIIAGIAYGSAGLSVVGICSPLFFLGAFLGTVVSGGSSALAAKYIAKDDNESVNRMFVTGIVLSVAIACVVTTVLLIFRAPILSFIVKDDSLIGSVQTYYVFFVFYMAFTVLAYIPLYWVRVLGRPEVGVVLTSVLTCCTVALSLLFSFVLKMGIESVALAQALATAIALLVSMALIKRRCGLPKRAKVFGWREVSDIFVIGSPMAMMRLYSFVSTLVLNQLLITSYGSAAVAVYGAIANITRFINAFVSGSSSVVVPMTAVFGEEKDTNSIRQLIRSAATYGNIVVCAVALCLAVFGRYIGQMFGLTALNLDIFRYAIVAFACYYVLFFNNNVLASYYNASRYLYLAHLIPLLQDLLLLLGFAFVLVGRVDVHYVWACFPLASLTAMVLLVIVLLVMKRRNAELELPLLMNLQYERSGRYTSFSVEPDVLKASEAAEKISEFCMENDLPPKTSMLLSMSIEELLTLIINAQQDGNRDQISVRILINNENDVVVMRIRNGGKKFNAIDYYEKNISTDFEKSMEVIGVKYVVEKADMIDYRDTFGVNNLVIIL